MAKKKNIDYLPIIGIAVAGAAGFFIYRYVKNKKGTPTPEPTPEPTPTPTPAPTPKTTPKSVAAASAAQKKQLQDLLISLFAKYTGNKINDFTYTAVEAKGGWGALSERALQIALSASTGNSAYTETLNANNAARYINAVTKVNEIRAKQLKDQQTKQTDKATQQKTAKEIVRLLEAGGHKAELLVDLTAPAIQFDNVRNTYITLGETRKFSKGTRFTKGDLVERGDGTVLYKSGLKRYPINPNQLLTSTR